jgi:hypothetical protein
VATSRGTLRAERSIASATAGVKVFRGPAAMRRYNIVEE